MFTKDSRRSDKHKASRERISKHGARTKKDQQGPRQARHTGASHGRDRTEFRKIAEETFQILQEEGYNLGKTFIPIHYDEKASEVITAVVDIPPSLKGLETEFEVFQQTSLEGAAQLVSEGHSVAVLNFASAKNPGGGFLKGSNAQEESLCRASALYGMLSAKPVQQAMYNPNKQNPDGSLYADRMVYSPNVPVFRDSEENLLLEPYSVAFLSVPAVNRTHALRKHSEAVVTEHLNLRIRMFLSVAAQKQHSALVLGAWGCGVFGNSSETVARLFADNLSGEFRGCFTKVIFCVLEDSDVRIFSEIFSE